MSAASAEALTAAALSRHCDVCWAPANACSHGQEAVAGAMPMADINLCMGCAVPRWRYVSHVPPTRRTKTLPAKRNGVSNAARMGT